MSYITEFIINNIPKDGMDISSFHFRVFNGVHVEKVIVEYDKVWLHNKNHGLIHWDYLDQNEKEIIYNHIKEIFEDDDDIFDIDENLFDNA